MARVPPCYTRKPRRARRQVRSSILCMHANGIKMPFSAGSVVSGCHDFRRPSRPRDRQCDVTLESLGGLQM